MTNRRSYYWKVYKEYHTVLRTTPTLQWRNSSKDDLKKEVLKLRTVYRTKFKKKLNEQIILEHSRKQHNKKIKNILPFIQKRMRRMIQRGEGRIDYVRDTPQDEDLTSADVTSIIDFVQTSTDLHSPNDAFLVSIEGIVEGKHGEYETLKQFPAQRIDNFEDFVIDFNLWSNAWFNGNHDYSVDIHRIVVSVIPANAGGCRPTDEKINNIEGDIYVEQRSSNNNCFFKALKEELNLQKITKGKCNTMRDFLSLPRNSMISASNGILLFEKFRKDASLQLAIKDAENDCYYYSNEFSDEKTYSMLLLKDDHYQKFKGEILIHKCPICYVSYKNKHSCKADLYPKCNSCGHFHDKERLCNPKQVSYYQSKICENEQRYLIDKYKKDVLDLKSVYHYDIETHANNETKTHEPYIVGWNEKEKFKSLKGENCMRRFVEYFIDYAKSHFSQYRAIMPRKYTKEEEWAAYLIQNPNENYVVEDGKVYQIILKPVYLNAFNGANFDHYFFIKTCIALGLKIEKFLLNNGSIIQAKIGNIILIDLRKHCTGSLSANLKEWKCDILKGDFDHSKGNQWELMDEKTQTDCIKYLKADVMGLKELYDKMASAVFNDYKVNLFKFMSTSQLTYHIWVNRVLSSGIKGEKAAISIPTLDQEQYFRPSIFGGRCYKSKNTFYSSQRDAYLDGKLAYKDIYDYLKDLDVNSLYPAAMRNFVFPIGVPVKLSNIKLKKKMIKTDELDSKNKHIWKETIIEEKTTDLHDFNAFMKENRRCQFMGIFHIRYTTNKNLAHAILPSRTNEGLKWNLNDGVGFYNSVDIDNALDNGYDIEITKNGGYYWKQTAPIFKSYIDELYIKKKNAKKGTPAYILAKLFMNGLYGKMIQRPINENGKFIEKNSQFWKFFNSNVVSTLTYVGDKMYVKGYSRNEKKLENNVTKPTYLGSFILAYSRRIMIDYMKRTNPYFDITHSENDLKMQVENDLYYTDTDSIQIHARNAIDEDNELGGISDDLGNACKILRAFWIAPKLYMLEYIKEGSLELHYHFKGKGVAQEELNEKVYEWMNRGNSLETCRSFQMKKINITKNSKQQHLDNFSIIHKTWEDTRRTLNMTPWNGRYFIDENNSIPFGHV